MAASAARGAARRKTQTEILISTQPTQIDDIHVIEYLVFTGHAQTKR
jgi:hypothetical protein